MSTYTIQRGDTLSGIASKNGTTVSTLMELNPYITNPDVIYAGNSLTLPGTSSSSDKTTKKTTTTNKTSTPKTTTTNKVTTTTQTPIQTTQQRAEEYARQQTASSNNDTQALLTQYEKIAENQKKALQQQQQLTVNKINSQKDEVYQDYNDNARQAYINSMLGKKSVEQELSKSGLNTSGLVGSAYANVENAYGNNLASLQTSRDKAINDINRQLIDAEIEYSRQESELLADIENAKLEIQQYGNELAWNHYQDAITNYLNFENLDHSKYIDERDFNYQVSRDNVADEQWTQQFNYQKGRDQVADNQWTQEFNLAQKKNSNSGSSSSGSRSNSVVESFSGDDEPEAKDNADNNILKVGLRSAILGAYQAGKIDDNYAEQLFNKLGL